MGYGNDQTIIQIENPDLTEVNALLAQKAQQSDLDNTNTRIDNIVAQAGTDNTEIVDARQSTVKNKTFTTLDGRLEDIENNIPIASYTYNGNAEIIVSGVDVDTNVFTSAGHGLVNNDRIFPTLNLTALGTYPFKVYAGGLEQKIYYVVNATTDSFQLSLTSGGATIDLITNATMDLTKWHFEKGVSDGIIMSSLPPSKKYRIKAVGKFSSSGAKYLQPYAPSSWSDMAVSFVGTNDVNYAYPSTSTSGIGNIKVIAETIFDTARMYLSTEWQLVDSDTADASKLKTYFEKKVYSIENNTIKDSLVTAVRFKEHNQFVANGTTVEVYKV